MKRIYKIISIICVCILSFNILTVIGSAKGTGTEADPYIITTAEELQNINNNISAHYKLGANIDLADMEFTPIGNVDTGSFTGSFDGNGYTIYNLDVYSGKYAGLFGSNEGVIKNVVLDNIYVYGTRYIGGVVAYNTTLGTVGNCKVLSGLVETDGGINDIQIGGICGINEGAFNGSFSNGANIDVPDTDVSTKAGGICGYWNSSVTEELNNLSNTGNISSSEAYYFGGLIGSVNSSLSINKSYNKGNIRGYCSGGLVGYTSEDLILIECYNTGNISSNSTYNEAGGLVGEIHSSAVAIRASYNTGKITSSQYAGGLVASAYESSINIIGSYNTGNISSGKYSGGLVGCFYNSDCYTIITNSYNTGNVSSNNYSGVYPGGLIGYMYDNYYDTSYINNCYNTGNIYQTRSYDGYGPGGLVGYRNGVKINCSKSYNKNGSLLSSTGSNSLNGTTLSWNDIKKQSSYIDWDFDEVWEIDGTVNNGYPVLKTTASPLTLNLSNETMLAGSTLQLIAYKNSVVTNDVIWSVTSGSATVSSTGLVTAGSGLATVTATDSEGNKANFNTYIITKATSLTATDRTINLSGSGIKNTSYFTVNGSDTDFVANYESSDTSVLTVDGAGYLTPVKVGTATITATTAGGVSATQTVTVEGSAKSISIPTTLTVSVGSTKKITATTSPNPTSSVITWKSSDTSVATVDSNGNVSGLKSGTTIITATTDNGYSATCTVTVNAPITEMAFETPSLTLYRGETYKLKLNITPTYTTDTITYSTSSSSKASVSSTGLVTVGTSSSSTGTVTITATSSSGQKAYCNITIKNWPSALTVVASSAKIDKKVITTDLTGVRNLEKLVSVKDGYNIEVTYSHQTNGLNYCGTGTTIDVYDDYGNFVITYTLVVNGDVNGDSIVDVLDATNTERMATDAMSFNEAQAYAANGAAIETVDATSYQYVLNKALAE